jgi:hypothetical protein
MRPKSNQIVKGRFVAKEADVHYSVVQWLKLKWPKVLFHTDSAGELVFHSQRQRHAKLNHEGIKWPDLQILEARRGYFGCLIEIKREGENLYNDKGMFKTNHLLIQSETLQALSDRNYYAVFSKGFTDTVRVIDWYLSGEHTTILNLK